MVSLDLKEPSRFADRIKQREIKQKHASDIRDNFKTEGNEIADNQQSHNQRYFTGPAQMEQFVRKKKRVRVQSVGFDSMNQDAIDMDDE